MPSKATKMIIVELAKTPEALGICDGCKLDLAVVLVGDDAYCGYCWSCWRAERQAFTWAGGNCPGE